MNGSVIEFPDEPIRTNRLRSFERNAECEEVVADLERAGRAAVGDADRMHAVRDDARHAGAATGAARPPGAVGANVGERAATAASVTGDADRGLLARLMHVAASELVRQPAQAVLGR